MSEVKVKIGVSNLNEDDVKNVKRIIRQARKAKSLSEIRKFDAQLKRIDAKNRKRAVADSIIAKYKAEGPSR